MAFTFACLMQRTLCSGGLGKFESTISPIKKNKKPQPNLFSGVSYPQRFASLGMFNKNSYVKLNLKHQKIHKNNKNKQKGKPRKQKYYVIIPACMTVVDRHQ